MSLSKNQIIAVAVVAIVAVAALAAVFLLRDGGSGNQGDQSSSYENGPVTITTFTDYNGSTADITFNEIPERVVVGCNTALNLLLYLGLEDRIVGVYYNEEEVWDEVADEYASLVERIGEVDASGSRNLSQNIQTSVLLSWEPDLVIGWVSWNADGLGTEEFFNDNGCNVMSFNTMTSSQYRTVELMKQDYDNIGNIFDVKDQTDRIYNQIVSTINTVKQNLAGGETYTYCLIDGSVDVDEGTLWAYNNRNFIASVLNEIGLANAFPDGGTISLATVYEAIGTTDIDLIIFIEYDNVKLESSLQSWIDDPDLSQCAAVKNGDYFGMKLSCSYGTSPELLDVLQYVNDYVNEMSGVDSDAYPGGPVTVTTFTDYNGSTATITFNEIPDRVVVGCNTALNLLLYLGLEDRIVGAYYNEEEVWDVVADEYAKLVQRIGEVDASGSRNLSQNISTDVLLSWEPDLVIGWVSWNADGLGTEQFFNDNGCNVMSFNTMTSSQYRTVELMKQDYDNIGNIFNVKNQTDYIYSQIVDTIETLTANMEGQDTIYYCLIDGSVDADDGTLWAYNNRNFIASVLNGIGLTNAFPDGGTIPLATVYEAIGTTDIDLIIFIEYDNVKLESSLQSWIDDPDLSQCAAIQNQDYIGMKLSCSYGTSPELLDVLQYVYDYVSGMSS